MDFFNKLGKKASEAYKATADKTGKMAKEAKLRMKIGELRSQINDIYKQIGEMVYIKHTSEENCEICDQVKENCSKIKELNEEIEKCQRECLELKDKRQCTKCNAEIDKNVAFCPNCGEKQEIQESPAQEVEVIEKENQDLEDESNTKESNTDEKEKTETERTVEIESDVNLEPETKNEEIKQEEE